MTQHDTLFILAATYPTTDEAVADYEAVQEVYRAVRTSHDFDAAVIQKDDSGDVDIVRRREQPTRHGAAVGLGWGLAAGLAAAVFPPIGVVGSAAMGATGGAAMGALAGHARGGMPAKDLRQMGDLLDDGTAGLIAVYEMTMADQVEANITAVDRMLSSASVDTDRLAADLRRAQRP